MTAVEFPPDVGLVLGRLRDALRERPDLIGIYVYGSLLTGDFSPARSDIDVVVLLDREPDPAAVRELTQLHAEVITAVGAAGARAAGQLHCLYVAAEHAADPDRLCTYWFGDRMTQWQLKVLTQAELASDGVALSGPWPPPGLRPVAIADIQAAVAAELRGYWTRFARTRLGGCRTTPSTTPSSCCRGPRPSWRTVSSSRRARPSGGWPISASRPRWPTRSAAAGPARRSGSRPASGYDAPTRPGGSCSAASAGLAGPTECADHGSG